MHVDEYGDVSKHNPLYLIRQCVQTVQGDGDEEHVREVLEHVRHASKVFLIVSLVMALALGVPNCIFAYIPFEIVSMAVGTGLYYFVLYGMASIIITVPIILVHLVVMSHTHSIARLDGNLQSLLTVDSDKHKDIIDAIPLYLGNEGQSLSSSSSLVQPLVAYCFVLLNCCIAMIISMIDQIFYYVGDSVDRSVRDEHKQHAMLAGLAVVYTALILFQVMCIISYCWIYWRLASISGDLKRLKKLFNSVCLTKW